MFTNPNDPQMANPNGSPFQLGSMVGPPQPRQMQVKTQMVKVPPPNPVIAPPDPADVPNDQPEPVEAAKDPNVFTTPEGKWTITDKPEKVRFNNGSFDVELDTKDAPDVVKNEVLKRHPGPDEYVDNGQRYKISNGTVQAFLPNLNKFANVPADNIDVLPASIRNKYYESKGTSDRNTGEELLSSPMFGGVTPNQEQIHQQEQNIQGISQSMGENQGLHGITSPEQLDQARTQAETDLKTIQASGDKTKVAAAKEKLQNLKDMKIVSTPEGGYIMYVKAPIGDQYIVHTVSPKEPKKSGEYDWTKDPMQVHAEATARAQNQNRDDVMQSSGGIIFNNSAQRIVRDYANSYAKWYRSQQLAGDHPSAPLPELLAQKLATQMNPATADPDGARDTIIEMQKALADVHGSGYMALKPDYGAMSTFNNGVSDYGISRIPSPTERGYDVKSQLIANPKTAAAKDIKETPLALPGPNGTLDHAETAIQKTIHSMQADPTNADATLASHEQTLYQQPNALIKNYVTPSGTRPDSADRATAFDQHIQERMTDPIFRKKFISGIANAIEDAAGDIELAHTDKGGTTTTRGEGEDAVTTTKVKDATIQDSKYKEAYQNMFGSLSPSNTPLYYQDKSGNRYKSAKDSQSKDAQGKIVGDEAQPVYPKWSDEGAVKKYTKEFLSKTPQEQLKEVEKGGAYAKTLYMLEGVAAGRNGHLEIDSRLGSLANDRLQEAAQAALLPEANTFVKNNSAYFDANKRTMADPDTKVNEAQLSKAINQNLIIRAISKMMGQTLQK